MDNGILRYLTVRYIHKYNVEQFKISDSNINNNNSVSGRCGVAVFPRADYLHLTTNNGVGVGFNNDNLKGG